MAAAAIPRWRPPPSWIISNRHISQQLTINLYSAHRAVIFAIAQLSCSECLLNVLNQDMLNIISDSSNPLQPAAARLEPLHDQLDDARNEQRKLANWFQQKGSSYTVNCTVQQLYVRSLHQALFATYVDALVPCPGSHQLLALDSCASARHGATADDTLNSSGIPSLEFHGPEDEQAVLRHPRRSGPRAEQRSH